MEINIKIGDQQIDHSDESSRLTVERTLDLYTGLFKLLSEATPTALYNQEDNPFKFELNQLVTGVRHSVRFSGRVIRRVQSISHLEGSSKSKIENTYCVRGSFTDNQERTLHFYEKDIQSNI